MTNERGKEMLAAERWEQIEALINHRGSVQVDELAQQFSVSPMTIRRDLVQLQKAGKLERCHGGAVAKKEVAYAEKQISQKKEKRRIAKKCASYVKMGDNIFLDAGTTTYEIAKILKEREGLFIVTNDLEIATLLKDSKAELFLCGGIVQKETGSISGVYACRMLENFKFDIGFFGMAAINDDFEAMTPTENKMWLKRQALSQCRQSYLAVDSSKFGRQAARKINHLRDYTGVVTDRNFSEEEQIHLQELGINVIWTGA